MKFIFALTAFTILLPLTAHAHQIGGFGFSSGATHPLGGLDHLLAMVAVGIISMQIGGRSIWKVPMVFVIFMLVGGALAIAGFRLPAVEQVIALSVLVFGAAIAVSKKLPIGWAFTIVALFAVFHGHAHGEEMPLIASPALYAIGLILSTAFLHVSGILIGHFAFKRKTTLMLLRYFGTGMSIAGITFLLNVV